MSDSGEFEKLVGEITAYTNNLKRFYSNILYLETKPAEDGNEVREAAVHYSGKLNDSGNEIDLFGNVINRREPWESTSSLDEFNSLICECQKCPLGHTRNKFVFGVGNPEADIMLIGEAPGAEEDIQGEPFVGRAGKLLDKILEAVGFKREEVYICNILKCRPPGNRNPQPDEIEKCIPYLYHQIKIISPKIILLLGRVAAEALLKSKQPLNKMREKVHLVSGIKTMVTFHPAALLRNPQWKRPAWEDMKEFRRIYESMN